MNLTFKAIETIVLAIIIYISYYTSSAFAGWILAGVHTQ